MEIDENKFKHTCSEEDAPKFWEWIQNRGGVAVWKSLNLGNAGASWSTPATIKRKDCQVQNPHLLSREMWERLHASNTEQAYFHYCQMQGTDRPSLQEFRDRKYAEHVAAETKDPEEILPYPKVNWQMANAPDKIFTNPEERVFTRALYKAFPVKLRGEGLSLVLADASNRRVKAELAKCEEKHGDSFYRHGVLDIDGASIGIYYTTGSITLAEWHAKQSAPV